MCYIICYYGPILNLNPKTRGRRGLITYNTTNGIIALSKHVNVDYYNIYLKIIEKLKSPLKEDEK
jgi:hypothetical protein